MALIHVNHRASATIIALVFVAGLFVGGIVIAYVNIQQINSLNETISILRSQVSALAGTQNVPNQYVTIYDNGTNLSAIYERLNHSILLIRNTMSNGSIVEGSGFICNSSGTMIVITNNHVVAGSAQISVTFADGHGYAALVNGTDPYADLAILTIVDAPPSELIPIEIVNSSMLKVGDRVIAIGNPYGLVGSMTTGIISALGRTMTEEFTGGFRIANIIQTSAPINPGNSGGPLLNYDGKVVGITTAIIENSQGLGFAIPSSTITRELNELITYGSYSGHSYLGVYAGANEQTDMTYELAQSMHLNVTYGYIVRGVVSGGPASNAGVMVNDLIIGMNATTIRNSDELSSYLETYTLPGETVMLNIVRGSQTLNASVVLAQRPPL